MMQARWLGRKGGEADRSKRHQGRGERSPQFQRGSSGPQAPRDPAAPRLHSGRAGGVGGRAGGGGGAPPTGGRNVSGGGGRSYLSHAAWWPGLAAVSVSQQLGSRATITKTKVNAPELVEEESVARDAEPGGAPCTAPSSGGRAPLSGPRRR